VRGFEQIPWLYDAALALAEFTGLKRWRQWLCEGARGRVLDLGSGTGRNLPLLPPDSVGVDPALDPLRRARRRAPAARLVQARAEALPFRDATFDTVVSGLVFCSVDDPPSGFREVRRVLRPAGALRMLEHVRSERPWRARVQDLIQPAWTRIAGGCRPNRATERTVEGAGFAIDRDSHRARKNLRRFVARPCSASDRVASHRPAG
jgi:ubiquinone/menaquinone biosynthesis C-methylase UbiE